MARKISNILYIFVEGTTDEVFFKNILEKSIKAKGKYTKCLYIKFGKDNFNKVQRKINAITNIHSFLLILDNDFGKNPKISKYSEMYPSNTEIVKNMIEGWLLAGFNKNFADNEKFRHFYQNTETINHHKFANSSPKQFANDENQFFEFLSITHKDNFDFREAQNNRNKSFNRFYEKYCKFN